MNDEAEQLTLYDLDSCVGRMFREPSAAENPRARTFGSSSRRSSELKAIPFLSLDLTPGSGNLLGEFYWELISPWLGGSSTLNTGPAPLNAVDVYTLSQILEAEPHPKYSLTRTACKGILRRSRERGKPLPSRLELALKIQAGLIAAHWDSSEKTIAFAANQRDEVRDLHDVAGALGAQPGMKQQTFVAGVVSKGDGDCFLTPDVHTSLSSGGGQAGQGYPCIFADSGNCLNPWDTQQARIFTPDGKSPTLAGADGGGGRNPAGLLFAAGFCAGAAPTAGGIGYQEDIAPTLKAADSGTNMVPSILCLNDQGGAVMEVSEGISGTLRAQEHGHQPLVLATQQGGAEIGVGVCPTITAAAGMSGNNQPVLFENHGIDSRYRGPLDVAPTLSARAGTGGNNLPLVAEDCTQTFCIMGNAIDRQPHNGGNGIGYQADIAYTLTATDHHAVYNRQRVDIFMEDDVASTESARQYKDATDLVLDVAGLDCRNGKENGDLCGTLQKGTSGSSLNSIHPVRAGSLIRRLTPLECERLQGYPDFWTALPGSSDSARYRALGNSVAIPCVEYVLHGIALALAWDDEPLAA